MPNALSFEALDLTLGEHAPFLISMSDGLQQELHIIIAAAQIGEANRNAPDLVDLLSNTRPIEIDEKRMFEICFPDYIIYQIRNESYCSYDPAELWRGRYLITFEKSQLLSRLSEITDAQRLDDGSFYPGKWTHYGIYTQNQIIDVVSHCPPTISRFTK